MVGDSEIFFGLFYEFDSELVFEFLGSSFILFLLFEIFIMFHFFESFFFEFFETVLKVSLEGI